MKKLLFLTMAFVLSLCLTACKENSDVIAPINNPTMKSEIVNLEKMTLEQKYDAKIKELEEEASDVVVPEKKEYEQRTSGVWHNIDKPTMVIEMTDNMFFASFPNTNDKDYYFFGKMTMKNGEEAFEELKIDSTTIEGLEHLSTEDYYSVIVDIEEMAKAGIDVKESINENTKAWYMIIFLKDDYIYVYDANNDVYNYYVRET